MSVSESPDCSSECTHWLREARSGNREAFCKLCTETTVNRLLVVICSDLPSRLRAKIDPENILQEVLDRAWRDLKTLKEVSAPGFRRWVCAIARHRVCDVVRYYNNRKRAARREEAFPRLPDDSAFRYDHTASDSVVRREHIAKVLQADDRLEEAETLLSDLLARQRRMTPSNQVATETTLIMLAENLIGQDAASAAEPLLRECLQARRRRLRAGHWKIGMVEVRLGECLTSLNRYAEAKELLISGYRSIRAEVGKHDRRTVQALDALANLHLARGRFAEADEWYTMLAHDFWVEPPANWKPHNPVNLSVSGEIVRAWSPDGVTSITVFIDEVSAPIAVSQLVADTIRAANRLGAEVTEQAVRVIAGKQAAWVVDVGNGYGGAVFRGGPVRIMQHSVRIPRMDDCVGLLLTTPESDFDTHEAAFRTMPDTLEVYGEQVSQGPAPEPENLDFEKAPAGARRSAWLGAAVRLAAHARQGLRGHDRQRRCSQRPPERQNRGTGCGGGVGGARRNAGPVYAGGLLSGAGSALLGVSADAER